MRFMVIVKSNPEAESGQVPTTEELDTMGKYNEELARAGILLSAEGLLSSAKGARVRFDSGSTTVHDGPFTETKELIAGFWLLQVRSIEEAVEWARRIPFTEGEVEIRQVAESSDFGDTMTPEIAEREQRLRDELADH